MNRIKEVSTAIEDGKLVCATSLHEKNDNAEFAFYIFRDHERIHISWYSGSSSFTFDIEGLPGEYQVAGFVRIEGEPVESAKSAPLLVSLDDAARASPAPTPGEEPGVQPTELESAAGQFAQPDYSAWRCKLHAQQDAATFLTNEAFENGIYRITCGSLTLDILMQGMPATPFEQQGLCLVGFGGAMANRAGTSPPYFSGRGVAGQLKLPMIGISDPSLNLNATLALGWYAGNSECRQLPQVIAEILSRIAQWLNVKLVMFGGSGGGFAALVQSTLVTCESIAIVWNPQTNISRYEPGAVLHYIATGFPELAGEARAVSKLGKSAQKRGIELLVEKAGILHSVAGLPLASESSVLYLQNRADWHVTAHAKPYFAPAACRRIGAASFAQDDKLAVHFGDWGTGHAPIPTELLVQVIADISQGMSVVEIAAKLDQAGSQYCQWFDADAIPFTDNPRVVCEERAHGFRLTVDVPALPSAEHLEYALYLFKNGDRIKCLGFQHNSTFLITHEDADIDAVQVLVRDFLQDIRIGYWRWPMCRSPGKFEPAANDLLAAEFATAFSRPLAFLPQDFAAIKELSVDAGGSISLPLANFCEVIEVSETSNIGWKRQFATANESNVMWMYSLNFLGVLLSTFEATRNPVVLAIASRGIESFVDFVAEPENRARVGGIQSGDHSTATRVKVLVKYLYITHGLESADDALRLRVFRELYQWLEWLSEDKHFHENNHGLMCSISLVAASQCFNPSSDLRDRYASLAVSRILGLAKIAFCKDGLCYENTIGYHNYNLGLYRIFLRLTRAQELDSPELAELESIIDHAEVALRHCIRQDNTIPPIGDSPVYLLKTPSINASKFFPDSGFAVVKNDDFYLSLQCGSRTEFHKQMDDASVTLRYAGIDILIDAGSYSYSRKTGFGRYVESATGHTGVYPLAFDHLRRKEVVHTFGSIVGGVDYLNETPAGVELGCHYHAKNGNISVKRTIVVRWPDEVWIHDEIAMDKIMAPVEIANTKVQRFLFAPDMKITPTGAGTYAMQGAGMRASLFSLGGAEEHLLVGQTEPDIRGWHSVNFGEILENASLEFTSDEPVASFTFVLKFAEGATLDDLSADLLQRLGPGRTP